MEKSKFIDAAVDHPKTFLWYLESEVALIITYNFCIVKVIIGDFLFDPHDEKTHSKRDGALSVFKDLEDAAHTKNEPTEVQYLNQDAYSVKISPVCWLKMGLGFI